MSLRNRHAKLSDRQVFYPAGNVRKACRLKKKKFRSVLERDGEVDFVVAGRESDKRIFASLPRSLFH